MAYVDYAFYTEVYGGTAIPSKDFCRIARRASVRLDAMTLGRLPADVAKVKMAACELCDLYYEEEARGGLASENNDGYAVSYNNKREVQARAGEIVTAYFGNSGCLYGGMA